MKRCFVFSVCAVLLACASTLQAQRVEAGRSVKLTITGVTAPEKQEFDGEYPVSEGGSINLPHVGPLPAVGLTSQELSAKIQNAYIKAGIYTNPTVQSVITTLTAGPTELVVHVAGQVQKNGATPYNPKLTVYQAVAAAGGATAYGAMNRVELNRGGKIEKIDLEKPAGQAVKTLPGDTITVREKNWRGR